MNSSTSLLQSILDMSDTLNWDVDRVILLVANFQFLLGVFLSFVIWLFVRLFRKLKLHFQSRK